MKPRSRMPVLAASIALIALGEVGGCAYDFDAPFEATEPGGGSSLGGSAGLGGAGGTSGTDGGGTGGTGGTSSGGSGGTSSGGTGGSTGGSGGTGGSTGGSGGTGGSTGGSGGLGGTGGSAGAAGVGGSGGAAGTSGAGGSTMVDGHACSLVDPGGTGDEPNGIIPVCCAPTIFEKPEALELFALLNEHRAANSVPELTYDLDLEATIEAHLIHQALHPFTTWNAPEAVVGSAGDRAALCGTSATGGVSGTNHATAAAAMNSWKANTAINDNMLDTNHARAGAGRYANRWALQFGP